MGDPLESHVLHQLDQRVDFWHEIRARAVLTHVPNAEPSVVADIGAGAGQLGAIMERDRPAATYRYFEPLEGPRDRLVARYGARECLVSPTDVAEADVVVALDVVEHVADDAAFVRELVRDMREGATLVLTVPALPLLWSSWDVQLGHHRRYTKRSLALLLATIPVDVVELDYLFPELLPPVAARRLRRHDAGVEFPQLPRTLDRLLFGLSCLTFAARRWMPAGTSLLCVARRRPAAIREPR